MKYPALMHNLVKVSGVVTVLHQFILCLSFCWFTLIQYIPFLDTVQCSAQPTCYQRSGNHRTPFIPLTCKIGTGTATGRPPSSVGWWQRACWGLLPCCYVRIKDLIQYSSHYVVWVMVVLDSEGVLERLEKTHALPCFMVVAPYKHISHNLQD